VELTGRPGLQADFGVLFWLLGLTTVVLLLAGSGLLLLLRFKSTIARLLLPDITEARHTEEQLRRREQYLTLLNDITRAAVAAAAFSAMRQILADRMGQLIDADGCYVLLWDESTRSVIPSAAYGKHRDSFNAFTFPPGDVNFASTVLDQGRPLAIEEAANSPLIAPQLLDRFPSRSLLVLPLIAGMQKLGAAVLAFEQPHHFTPDEIERGEQASAQIALVIAQARYLDAQQRSAHQLELLYDVSRQIAATLAGLAAAGTQARYFCADVQDRRRLGQVVRTIRKQLGPVSGLIHGAGVLEDRLIGDKTAAQFTAVFATKVAGLDNLLAATAEEPLRHIVVFSSVAARFGNKGQADYAMANEALNKLAGDLRQKRPDCRVVAINWGPWDGGMVGPALKNQFEASGIALIPPQAGSRLAVDLMAADNAAVELVVGGPLGLPPLGRLPDPANDEADEMALAVKRQIDTIGHPILNDHVIDGRPVVPMALMVEWLGHGALHDHPGLVLHGMDELRVLAGIKLDEASKAIRLMAARSVQRDAFFEVGVEIRDGVMADGRDMIHARGKAILAETTIGPPAYAMPAWKDSHPYSKTVDTVYDTILFHGRGLRAIRQIQSLGPQGMIATMAAAPSPGTWITQPLRSRWLSDPLILDGAFQMATIWCYENRGVVSLPSFAAAYRQYVQRFPAEGVTAVMEVRAVNGARMKADFTFLDPSATVVAMLSGVESVMDPGLEKAFARRHVIEALGRS